MSKVEKDYATKEILNNLGLVVYFDRITYDNGVIQIRANIYNTKNKNVDYYFGKTKNEVLEGIKMRYKKNVK